MNGDHKEIYDQLILMSEKMGEMHGTLASTDRKVSDICGLCRDRERRIRRLEGIVYKGMGAVMGLGALLVVLQVMGYLGMI